MRRRRLGPIPPRTGAGRSPQWLWDACCRGDEPAETLDARDREDLVAQLLAAGWTIANIAAHSRMTVYTTQRLTDRVTTPSSEGAA